MEEVNKNKKYRIDSVYYEFSRREIKGGYSDNVFLKIDAFLNYWSDVNFDKTDAYIYFDDLEKELVPPELTPTDRKRLIKHLENKIEVVNK